jgi:hypothetical protein
MLAEQRTHLLIVLTSMATSNGPEPFVIFVLARATLGAVKSVVSMNDCVLFCTAAYEAEENSPKGQGRSERHFSSSASSA